jgi:hypothetical protein
MILNSCSRRFYLLLPCKIREALDSCFDDLLIFLRGYFPSMIVTSGFRSPSYNRSIGGQVNSFHQYSSAVDIRLNSLTDEQIKRFKRENPLFVFHREKDHYHIACPSGWEGLKND